MTWTPTIGDSLACGREIETTVTFSDGTRSFTEYFRNDGTTGSLRAKVAARIAELEEVPPVVEFAKGAALELVAEQARGAIDLPLPMEGGPVVDDPAQVFLAMLNRCRQLEKAIQRGWLASDDAEYVALSDALAKSFDRAYVDAL